MIPKITGLTLIEWGFKPGPWFNSAIIGGNQFLELGHSLEEVRELIQKHAPVAPPEILPRTNNIPFGMFLEPETDDERVNHDAVVASMDALMRTPDNRQGRRDAGCLPCWHNPSRRRGGDRERDPSWLPLGRHLLLDGGLGLQAPR